MNIISISIKLFLKSSIKNNINFKSFFSLLGTSFGVFFFIISLTFMETIEKDMEENIIKIVSNNKILIKDLSSKDLKKIEEYLYLKNIDFFSVQEGSFLINHDKLHLINVISINELEKYIENNFTDNYTPKNDSYDLIVGHYYDNKNNIVDLISTSNFNFFTGIPKRVILEVSGFINFDFLNFDANNILINSEIAQKHNIFNNNNNKYLSINSFLTDKDINYLKKINESIEIVNWKDEYVNLFNSLKLEKYLYSIFGIIIIIISNFTFLISLSSLIIDKVKEFAIIEVLGFSKKTQSIIILIYSFFQNLFSLVFGIFLSYLFLFLNKKYNLIGMIFKNNLMLNFDFSISMINIIYIIIFSFCTITIAMIYPIILLNSISIKNKL